MVTSKELFTFHRVVGQMLQTMTAVSRDTRARHSGTTDFTRDRKSKRGPAPTKAERNKRIAKVTRELSRQRWNKENHDP